MRTGSAPSPWTARMRPVVAQARLSCSIARQSVSSSPPRPPYSSGNGRPRMSCSASSCAQVLRELAASIDLSRARRDTLVGQHADRVPKERLLLGQAVRGTSGSLTARIVSAPRAGPGDAKENPVDTTSAVMPTVGIFLGALRGMTWPTAIRSPPLPRSEARAAAERRRGPPAKAVMPMIGITAAGAGPAGIGITSGSRSNRHLVHRGGSPSIRHLASRREPVQRRVPVADARLQGHDANDWHRGGGSRSHGDLHHGGPSRDPPDVIASRRRKPAPGDRHPRRRSRGAATRLRGGGRIAVRDGLGIRRRERFRRTSSRRGSRFHGDGIGAGRSRTPGSTAARPTAVARRPDHRQAPVVRHRGDPRGEHLADVHRGDRPSAVGRRQAVGQHDHAERACRRDRRRRPSRAPGGSARR